MLLFATQPLGAQVARDVAQGREFAQRVCAACHAIRPGAALSPVVAAPTFSAIAATPGMSPIALRVALQSVHRTMPNFALTGAELDDVIAYIMSLQRRN
jgi:mono/diheme cytochrome c family protein